MILRMVAVCVMAAMMAGCVSDGAAPDFATLSKNLGPPRPGQARIVLLRPQPFPLISFDVKLDGAPLAGLKGRTYVYADRPAGTHHLTGDAIMFPGTTDYVITAQSGRTYFFRVDTSKKSDALTAMGAVGGLAGYAIGAIATSKADNPGPLEFVPLDSAAAMRAMAELRLGS
jgi:Protein of unknown function (DUF2846)